MKDQSLRAIIFIDTIRLKSLAILKRNVTGGWMNKAAITKHEIYNKLIDFSEQDLNEIDKYIDFLRFKNKSIEKKKNNQASRNPKGI